MVGRLLIVLLLVAALAGSGYGAWRWHENRSNSISQPTQAGAMVFLKRSFAMYDAAKDQVGKARIACTYSESKNYLAADPHCAASSARQFDQIRRDAVDFIPSIRIILNGLKGRAIFTWTLKPGLYVRPTGRRTVQSWQFLRFEGGRWWITGDQKTGDRG